ncbi:MAG TPA: Hsp70 family protein [Gemmataceae bacterium]|jgi:molecular chaperone DnaK|nr:Hsp70 family protein [Gemmataceae bacterium]
MPSGGKLVGIDLGTTFSAVATLDDRGQPITLPNRDGDMLTPSAVLLCDDGTAVVGQSALDVALEQPDRVATLVKRRMGHPTLGHPVAGRDFRPETLSALILRKLVQDAELRLGPIDKAVITVPAYFDDTRRKATKDAGRIAGLEVLDILDEPTAAALAYSFQPPRGGEATPAAGLPGEERTVLVYDLGGGTFDVTLVRLSQDRFQTLAIEGDVRLGGKDWDDRIIDHVATQFQKQTGADPRGDPLALANLAAAAERAKRTLSKLPQATVTCTHAGRSQAFPLTRSDFEGLTRDLLMRTRFTTQQLLRQAGLGWDEVDRVLLVGGSTHMPMTRQMLQELAGKEPDHTLAVSEVVARGAALHAGIVAAGRPAEEVPFEDEARDRLAQVVEINVNAHSLGVEVKNQQEERVNDVLIPKNTQLPTAFSRVYYTKAENQQRVRVKVLQGEAPKAEACISIGECWIEGLPPHLPKASPVQVRYAVSSNGLIDVMALDMTSGKMARTNIHRSSGLSDEEIAREAEWVRGLKIQ